MTPEAVKSFAIRTFGDNDKTALVVGTLILLALFSLALGVLALRSRLLGVLGIALFGLVGAVAAVTRPAGGIVDALPSVAGGVAGVVALLALLRPLTLSQPLPAASPSAPDEQVLDRLREVLGAGDRKGAGLDRRRFFLTSGVALGAAALTGGGGQLLRRRFDVADDRREIKVPAPAFPAGALPQGADLAGRIDGLTPLITPNGAFYRVDTALTVPQIRRTDYRLSVSGMFDSPRSHTLEDLFGRSDLIERDITLTCVSNEVGGTLAGTARWIGVPLGAFLRENGIRSNSTQLVCRSSDGMTIGAPTRAALGTEDAMLAFGMNGEPLPVEHGFPVRMIIPGAVRLRLRLQVADRHRGEHLRGLRRLLGAARLGAGGADQDRRPHRHPALPAAGTGGAAADRRRRLGAGSRHLPRRGAGRRWGVAGDAALPRGRCRYLAAVGPPVRLPPRPAPDHRAGHRRPGPPAGRGSGQSLPGW